MFAPEQYGRKHRYSIRVCCKRVLFPTQGFEQKELVDLQDVPD